MRIEVKLTLDNGAVKEFDIDPNLLTESQFKTAAIEATRSASSKYRKLKLNRYGRFYLKGCTDTLNIILGRGVI